MTLCKSNLLILLLSTMLLFIASNSYALESSLVLYKVDQDKSHGYSLSVGDEVFGNKNFVWQLSYNRYENISIKNLDKTSGIWDDADFDFSIQSTDLMLGYRFYPKSYNKFIDNMMLDFHLGAAVNLNDHKFVFRPDFDRDDVYFAEKGDINAVASIALHKNFTRNTGMLIGIKYYPQYSDFGSISSIYIGFNYRFGRPRSY